MTNSVAFALILLIAAGFAVDQIWLGGTWPLFLARQFVSLVEWVSFWR
ncbi:MAG: hypothetical protein Q4G36_11280 [Paracoccus sp. (in: a-proteobacteria)]|nr:hypothetical protein [Paracoccus sp. (in: a-proteobacteria)]